VGGEQAPLFGTKGEQEGRKESTQVSKTGDFHTLERVGMCLPWSQTLVISPLLLPRTSRYEIKGDSEEWHEG